MNHGGPTPARRALQENVVAASGAVERHLDLILQYFVQEKFITSHESQGIRSMTGVTAAHKAGRALNGVEVKVDSGNDPNIGRKWLERFVWILRRQDVGEWVLARDIAKSYVNYAARNTEGYDFFSNIACAEGEVVTPPQATHNAPPPLTGRLNLDRDVLKAKRFLRDLEKNELKDLFQELGLSYSTARNSYSNPDKSEYAEDLIRAWILGKDDVLKLGGATWENLRKALGKLKHSGIAANII